MLKLNNLIHLSVATVVLLLLPGPDSYAQTGSETLAVPAAEINRTSNTTGLQHSPGATPTHWRRNSIKFSANLLMPGITYSFALNNHIALQANVYTSSFVYFTDDWIQLFGGWSGTSTAYTPEVRYYAMEGPRGPAGIYMGLYARYRHDEATGEFVNWGFIGPSTTDYSKAEMHSFGGGTVVGYQWIAKKGFTLDVFGGVGIMHDKTWTSENAYKHAPIVHNGFRPSGMGGCSLGYSF
ncbi:MAG: DUF3575 domain-containing protein [Bacteroidota bacterium]